MMTDFKTNDRVRHYSRGLGTAVVLSDGNVRVEFDERAPRGQKVVGIYDQTWFAIHPNGLVCATDTGSVT
jgi:hypothetical protein